MSDQTTTKRLDDILAQAKALRFAAAHGAIEYNEAKAKSEKLLIVVNQTGQRIAKKYGRRYKRIRFIDL